MLNVIWLIPLLPLCGFVINVVLGRRLGDPKSGLLAAAMCGAAFIVTLAGMLVFRGLTLWLLDGQNVGPFPKSFQSLSTGFIPDAFGVGKPDPRIFHEAAARAGVPAEAVLHIGDDAHLDGVGALGAGMQCVWINRDGHDWPSELSQPLTYASLSDLLKHLQA